MHWTWDEVQTGAVYGARRRCKKTR